MALRRLAVALAAIAVAMVPSAATPSAGGRNHGLHFTQIRFDPPGRDDDHLDDEYVTLWNRTGHNLNLKGWTIHDLDQENTYTFEKKFVLYEDARLTLVTGRGKDTVSICIDYCGRNSHPQFTNRWNLDHQVWDNTRDRATLEKPDGRVVDRCGYGQAASRLKRC